jgi:hypothetical protein
VSFGEKDGGLAGLIQHSTAKMSSSFSPLSCFITVLNVCLSRWCGAVWCLHGTVEAPVT